MFYKMHKQLNSIITNAHTVEIDNKPIQSHKIIIL